MQLLSFLALWFAKAFASLTPRKPRRPPEEHILSPEEEEAAYQAWAAEVDRLLTALQTMVEQWKNGTLPEQIKRARKQANKAVKKTETAMRKPTRHPSVKYEHLPLKAPQAILLFAPITPHLRQRTG